MNQSNMNVIVFGESGSGKSSLVNLLLGEDKATVSDKAIGCTFDYQKYETSNFNLYDTVGLSEGAKGTVKQEFAVNQLIKLLKSLDEGVSLLVFVMEKGRIKKSLSENYNLFVDAICMKKVPVALVITHCEMEHVPGGWYDENKMHFENYGMSFDAVVSGSALPPTSVPPVMQTLIKDMNKKTVDELQRAIIIKSLTEPWKVVGGWRMWLRFVIKNMFKSFADFFSLTPYLNFKSDPLSIEDRLMKYFESNGYSTNQAFSMAKDIATALHS